MLDVVGSCRMADIVKWTQAGGSCADPLMSMHGAESEGRFWTLQGQKELRQAQGTRLVEVFAELRSNGHREIPDLTLRMLLGCFWDATT